MRTTIKIDDDVLAAARSLARFEGRTLGEVISDLARRGLQPSLGNAKRRSGFPVFAVDEDASPITPEMVSDAMEEGRR